MSRTHFMGYPRANGEYGIRNYVLVISTVHCANNVAQKVALKTGVPCITHDYGCAEFEREKVQTYRGLCSAALSPNVFAVVLIGLGCEQTDHDRLIEDITAAGKPVTHIGIQESGGVKPAIDQGTAKVREYLKQAEAVERVEVPVSELVIGVQCGGSDWTTALSGNITIGNMADRLIEAGGSVIISEVGGFPGSEHILADRAETPEIGLQIIDMCDELRKEYFDEHGQTIEEVNPTPGNKAGGITTLTEKSMGNVKKMGVNARIKGLLYAGQHVSAKGLWILDLRAPVIDGNATSGFAMSGAHINVFSTGRGTPTGCAVMPVLKLTGNSNSYNAMPDMFDYNAGVVLEGTSLEDAGAGLFDKLIDIASGEETMSEINENFEFIIPREKYRAGR